MATQASISCVASVTITIDPSFRWAFADDNRAEIEAHFGRFLATRGAGYNGRLYLMADWSLEAGALRGRAFATDFASLITWRDMGAPDSGVRNFFGAGVLHSADGALILAEMAAHTANAGLIYPPCGVPGEEDVVGTRVDIAASITREIAEETGFEVALDEGNPWLAHDDGARLALMRRIDVAHPADAIADAIMRHCAGDPLAEIARVHIVRGTGDIVPGRMQAATLAYIRHVFPG